MFWFHSFIWTNCQKVLKLWKMHLCKHFENSFKLIFYKRIQNHMGYCWQLSFGLCFSTTLVLRYLPVLAKVLSQAATRATWSCSMCNRCKLNFSFQDTKHWYLVFTSHRFLFVYLTFYINDLSCSCLVF